MSSKIDKKFLFPTPIWKTILPSHEEMNEQLLTYIKKLKNNDKKGIKKSNILGWHSPFFKLSDPAVAEFIKASKSIIEEAIDDMGWDKKKNNPTITAMWGVINSTNASNERHFHPNNFLSCAYYLEAPDNCGEISFYDPRDVNVMRSPKLSKNNLLNSDRLSIKPEKGLFILFPSYLHHSVEPNKSNKDRIVISFNFNL